MQARVDAIAAEPDEERRDRLLTETLAILEKYKKGEAISLLEMAVSKAELLRNAGVVLEHVNPFIGPFLGIEDP
eukprot:CAMPEP_0113642412 /NCGR_PEP_ID=MMETSP0017_2-20120614/22282_1 /TAXON_ID=2856 /ORGANISM="Cylindrotheca closterium" /LENGTH=73 /DNA_ID=CAMNT_0000553837 /DNA_START=1127 /DNA_END=1348 /DNA_ORIENTATION=- /assembly_acc=CAM_ASM_000147